MPALKLRAQLRGDRFPQPTFSVNWYLTDRVQLMVDDSRAVPIESHLDYRSANFFSAQIGFYS